jgi:hypothetical protein
MPTVTPGYGLLNGTVDGTIVQPEDWDLLTDTFDRVLLTVAEIYGSGPLRSTDYIGTVVPGSLAVQVSGTVAIIGVANDRIFVRQIGSVTLHTGDANLTGTIQPSTTNYFYKKQDGTYEVNTTGVAPANSIRVFSMVTNTTEGTSVDNVTGRNNLIPLQGNGKVLCSATDGIYDYLAAQLIGTGIGISVESDGAGGERVRLTNLVTDTDIYSKVNSSDTTPDYLANKLTPETNKNAALTVVNVAGVRHIEFGVHPDDLALDQKIFTVTPGQDKVIKWDFSAKGTFPNGGFVVYFDKDEIDQLPPYTIPIIVPVGEGNIFHLWLLNANDATAGGYGTATDIQLTPRIRGFGYVAAAGGADVVTEYALDWQGASGVNNLLYAQTVIQAGDTVVNTAVQTELATHFDIPANSLAVGDVLELEAWGRWENAGSPDTIALYVASLGFEWVSFPVLTVATAGAGNRRHWKISAQLIMTAIGVSGAFEASGELRMQTDSGMLFSVEETHAGVGTLDTTGTRRIGIQVTWSNARTSNTITMRGMLVKKSRV